MTAPWPEYEELYTQHFDELVARARSLVDDPDEAEDLVHDAFLILLERVERGGGGAPARALTDPRAFLFGCLRRLARNLRERGRRRSDLLNRRETPTLTPAQTDGIEARLLCEWVFARLHPAEAELLRMRYLEDASSARVADHLGISVGGVRDRVYRAVKRARGVVNVAGPLGETSGSSDGRGGS